MKPRFVLTGFAAEFSLRQLATELAAQGHAVTAVDLADGSLDPSAVPDGDGPIVLVTSQHLAATRAALARSLPPSSSNYAAPSTLRHRIHADLLVYIPHDLEQPVLPCEVAALSSFDLYCAPDADSWWAANHVPTVTTGWVGDFGDTAPLDDVPRVLFLTNVQHALDRGGIDHLRATIPTTLSAGLAVKLPVGSTADALGNALEKDGVRVLDPYLQASAVIRSVRMVATNGPSSVVAEAVRLGHRPICVEDPTLPAVHRAALHGTGAVVCDDESFPRRCSEAGLYREPGQPFDVARFLAAVHERLAA